jgi:hypothetical protein
LHLVSPTGRVSFFFSQEESWARCGPCELLDVHAEQEPAGPNRQNSQTRNSSEIQTAMLLMEGWVSLLDGSKWRDVYAILRADDDAKTMSIQ